MLTNVADNDNENENENDNENDNDNDNENDNDNDNVNENEINLPFSICNYIRIFILHFLFSSYISMR